MIDLNEITAACEALTSYEHRGWTEGDEFIARARTWLPALVEELTQTREALEIMETERDQWRMDWETAGAELLNVQSKLTQAREELAAVDEGLGDFYAPVLDPETEEPCGSFWKDHGVWRMREGLERARAEIARLQEYGMGLVDSLHEADAEIKRLRALVPLPGLLRRLADDASKRADDFANATPGVGQMCHADGRAALALAQRIEEANETALTPEAASRIWDRVQQLKAEATDDDQAPE